MTAAATIEYNNVGAGVRCFVRAIIFQALVQALLRGMKRQTDGDAARTAAGVSNGSKHESRVSYNKEQIGTRVDQILLAPNLLVTNSLCRRS